MVQGFVVSFRAEDFGEDNTAHKENLRKDKNK